MTSLFPRQNSQPSSVPAGMVRVRVMNAAPCENVTVHSWSHDFRASVGHTGVRTHARVLWV